MQIISHIPWHAMSHTPPRFSRRVLLLLTLLPPHPGLRGDVAKLADAVAAAKAAYEAAASKLEARKARLRECDAEIAGDAWSAVYYEHVISCAWCKARHTMDTYAGKSYVAVCWIYCVGAADRTPVLITGVPPCALHVAPCAPRSRKGALQSAEGGWGDGDAGHQAAKQVGAPARLSCQSPRRPCTCMPNIRIEMAPQARPAPGALNEPTSPSAAIQLNEIRPIHLTSFPLSHLRPNHPPSSSSPLSSPPLFPCLSGLRARTRTCHATSTTPPS